MCSLKKEESLKHVIYAVTFVHKCFYFLKFSLRSSGITVLKSFKGDREVGVGGGGEERLKDVYGTEMKYKL